MNRVVLSVVLAAALIIPATAPAGSWSLHVPVSYRTWTTSGSSPELKSAQSLSSPVLIARIGDRHRVLVQLGGQSASVDRSGSPESASSLSGLTDTRLGISSRFADGRLVLLAGLHLPTGLRDLDAGQLDAARALAPPYLGYRARQPGRGLDVGFGASYAIPAGRIGVLGVGGGYVHRGRFRLSEDGPDIRPGAETTLSAGLDARLSGMLVRTELRRQFYVKDGGSELPFREPPSTSVSVGAGTAGERVIWAATAGFSRKEEADGENSPFSGNYLTCGASIYLPVRSLLRVGVAGEIVSFTGSAEDKHDKPSAVAGGVGPALRLAPGGRISLEARIQRLFGDIDGHSGSGWDVALSIGISGG